MHFKSVTFDLDGTLLDTIADLAEGCRLMLAEIGAPPRSPAEVHSFVGKGMAVLIERCLTWDAPPSVERLQTAILSFKRHYAAVNGQKTTIYPGVLEGLAIWKAHGLQMGIVTNKPTEFTLPLLKYVGIEHFFDVVVCGDTTTERKPHPAPVLFACREMGVTPAENLHIGDSFNDVASARAAGSVAFCVPYGYNEGEPVDSANCDALVSDLLAAYQQALLWPSHD
jgi:phosphoglycolate phosphatase